ncbi:MAG: DUF4381 domain-containing protein [Magnetococcales bacterium]|nr:DUF4381 domain-containing protein [Magnetococcales bacterium]
MNNAAPPLELRDIHLPDPVAWWPPAPGWWLVAATPVVLFLVWWLYRHWSKRHRLRRAALGELQRLEDAHAKRPDAQRLAADLSALLRRVAIAHHPPEEVAGLAGREWLAWLDRALPTPEFSQGPGAVLISAPFQPDPDIDAAALLALCRRWIRATPQPIGRGLASDRM